MYLYNISFIVILYSIDNFVWVSYTRINLLLYTKGADSLEPEKQSSDRGEVGAKGPQLLLSQEPVPGKMSQRIRTMN